MGETNGPRESAIRMSRRHLSQVEKSRSDEEKAKVISGKCSVCGAEVESPGNFCSMCGRMFVEEKIRKDKRETQFLASAPGRIKMETPKRDSFEVEPDPAGSHDFGALEAALRSNSVVEGEVEKDWDPEIARVIDIRRKQSQGLVRKKQK